VTIAAERPGAAGLSSRLGAEAGGSRDLGHDDNSRRHDGLPEKFAAKWHSSTDSISAKTDNRSDGHFGSNNNSYGALDGCKP